MNQQPSETDFLKTVRATLDHSATELDERTVTRLEVMRRKALAQCRQPAPRRLAFAGGLLATATSVILLVSVWVFHKNPEAPSPSYIEDIGLLSAREDIDFFEELDFYQWLADEQQTG